MSLKLNRDGLDLKSSSSSSLQNMADAAMEVACETPLGNIMEENRPKNSNRLLAKPFVKQITPMINLQCQRNSSNENVGGVCFLSFTLEEQFGRSICFWWHLPNRSDGDAANSSAASSNHGDIATV
ncbi:hypothetical protein BASA50_005012 [Batrachochytrium salamandrivorans]|uniref:Uncharacterized protein n=1 Tax=Batrachochytrium salamandrivorans TaxID=1357716 RepID=A0ABQ8FDX3_9FUNG|nr:hypothetical protein BASA50_005012 [Batrachochytrium salamandrivorans]